MRLTSAFLATALPLLGACPALADDPPAAKGAPKEAQAKGGRTLDDVPAPFVPLHPRTTEDRDRVEALRLFAASRALEDGHKLTDALALLEKARKLSPDSPAILRRLSRLNLVLGRNDQAIAVARRLGIEPRPRGRGGRSRCSSATTWSARMIRPGPRRP